MSNTELARKTTVRDLVAAFQSAADTVRTAFGMIVRAQENLNAAFIQDRYGAIHISATSRRWEDDFDKPEETIERMKRGAWVCVVQRLELKRLCSIARWKALEEHLEKGKLPDITEESVAGFAQGYLDGMAEMHLEAIREVFEWLRPHHARHKTNTELEIGERVIIEYALRRAYDGKGFRVQHYRSQNLTALENVFSCLDGQGSISKGYQSELETAIEKAENGVGETEYFAFRCYKNQCLHLRFKRLDLLSRFNALAGGLNLKPEAA